MTTNASRLLQLYRKHFTLLFCTDNLGILFSFVHITLDEANRLLVGSYVKLLNSKRGYLHVTQSVKIYDLHKLQYITPVAIVCTKWCFEIAYCFDLTENKSSFSAGMDMWLWSNPMLLGISSISERSNWHSILPSSQINALDNLSNPPKSPTWHKYNIRSIRS